MKNRWVLFLTAISLASSALAATYALGSESAPMRARQARVRAHASRLFEYDKLHPQTLDAGELRGLSIALAFGDIDGAARLVHGLEATLPKP